MNFSTTGRPLVRLFAAIVFLVMSVAGATAQTQDITESHLEAARAAVEATNASKRYDNILPALSAQIKTRLIANQPDQEGAIEKIVNDAAIELAPRRGDLETEIATIYAKSFTEEELKQIAEFFNSEAGSRFLKLSPVLLRELEKVSRVWTNGMGRDLNLKVAEMMSKANPAAPAEGQAAKEGEEKPAK